MDRLGTGIAPTATAPSNAASLVCALDDRHDRH